MLKEYRRLKSSPRVLYSILLVGVLLHALPAYGQNTILGTSLNLTGGGSDRNQTSSVLSTGGSNSRAFYGIYPSLFITTKRQNSSFNARYALGSNHNFGRAIQPPISHTASLSYSTSLGPRWSASISDSFRLTDALGTVNALSGAVPVAAGTSLYSFSSVATRASVYTNGANAALNWALDPNSSIAFTATHSMQEYGSGTTAGGFLSNQRQFSGGVSFNQQLGTAESWSLSYRSTYSEYGSFGNSTAQSALASYSKQIGRSTTLQIGSGLTQVRSGGAGKLAYDALASISRTIQDNTFSLSFTQDSTQQVGVGSTTTNQRTTVNWYRAFGKVTAGASASAYDSKATLANQFNSKGLSATSNFGIPVTSRLTVSLAGTFDNTRGTGTPSLTQQRTFGTGNIAYALSPTLSISGGLTYQDVRQTGTFSFNQKRAFISLRYNEPNLLMPR